MVLKFALLETEEAVFDVRLVLAERGERRLDEVVEHFGLDALHEHLPHTFRLNLLAQSMQLRRSALVRRQFFLRPEMCRQDIFDERLLLN